MEKNMCSTCLVSGRCKIQQNYAYYYRLMQNGNRMANDNFRIRCLKYVSPTESVGGGYIGS